MLRILSRRVPGVIMVTTHQYKLKIEERDSYVFAKVESKVREGDARDPTYLERIAAYCARCKCTSILIEKFTPETFDVWETFTIAPKLAAIGHAEIKVALVEKGAQIPVKNELKIAIGERRCLCVHVFAECSEAVRWLTVGSEMVQETPHSSPIV